MDYLFIVRSLQGEILDFMEEWCSDDFISRAHVLTNENIYRSLRMCGENVVECCEVWQISEDGNEMKKIITLY